MKQQQLMQILKNILNSARSRQAALEKAVDSWKEYQQMIDNVESTIAKASVPDEPISTLSGLLSNIQKLNYALEEFKVSAYLNKK